MMNKEQVLEKLGEFSVQDLNMVMELLDQKRIEKEKNGVDVKWEKIFKPFNDLEAKRTGRIKPAYMYSEVWTYDNNLVEMITEQISIAEEKGYRWYDTRYQMTSHGGALIHSALITFRRD